LMVEQKIDAIYQIEHILHLVLETMQVEPMDLVLMCGAVRSLEAVTKDNDEFEVSPFLGPALASLGAYKEALAFLSNSEPRVDAYDINKHFIYVQELPYTEGGHGWKVWHASYVFAHLLCRKPMCGLLAGKSVLELGAGCGLPGLAAVHAGAASVVLSDRRATILANLEVNCELQDYQVLPDNYRCEACKERGRVIAKPSVKWLDWTEEAAAVAEDGGVMSHKPTLSKIKLPSSEKFEVVIASDCMYTAGHGELLCKVICKRLAPRGKFIMLLPIRDQAYVPNLISKANQLGLHVRVTPIASVLTRVGLPLEECDVSDEYPGGVVLVEGWRQNETSPGTLPDGYWQEETLSDSSSIHEPLPLEPDSPGTEDKYPEEPPESVAASAEWNAVELLEDSDVEYGEDYYEEAEASEGIFDFWPEHGDEYDGVDLEDDDTVDYYNARVRDPRISQPDSVCSNVPHGRMVRRSRGGKLKKRRNKGKNNMMSAGVLAGAVGMMGLGVMQIALAVLGGGRQSHQGRGKGYR